MAIEVVGTRNNGARLALACLAGDKEDLLGWAVKHSLWTGSTAYCMDTGESLVYDSVSGAWWPMASGGGGGGDVSVESNKEVSITKQDATEVMPSAGYNAMAKVTATPVLQEKTAASNGDIEPDAGYAGLKKVTVAVPAAPEGQTKDIRITQNGVSSVSPDGGFVLNQVNITTDVAPNLQNKTLTENGRYTADDGYDGLGEVTVDVAGGGSLETNKEVTLTENGTAEITPTTATETCWSDGEHRYNADGSVSQSSLPSGEVESQEKIGSIYPSNGVNYTKGWDSLYLYYFQIEDAATHETLALPANAKKSSRIGANDISGGEEQYDMDVENGYTIACYNGVLYLKNGDDYYFNFDFSISSWSDMYYAFFNVGIGGTKVTDAALIAALNAVTFATSIKLYSLYGDCFYPVTGFTQSSIEYDSDEDAAGSIWEYGDTNNQYPRIVRYDKIGTFLFLNEAQPTDIYYATYKGIRMYDGMEKVTVTVAIPLEENKAVSLTAPGETEITPTSGNAGMEKVTVTPVLQDKTITENGTYSADSGNAGLGEVTVAVPTKLFGYGWNGSALLSDAVIAESGQYKVLDGQLVLQNAAVVMTRAFVSDDPAPQTNVKGVYPAGVFNNEFYGNDTSKIYKTSDGITWTEVFSDYRSIAVWGGKLFAAEKNGYGIYMSADGASWTRIFTSTKQGAKLTVVGKNDNEFLIMIDPDSMLDQRAQILRTADGGSTCVDVTPVLSGISGQVNSLAYTDGVYVYAGGTGNGGSVQCYSTDDGDTWTEMNSIANVGVVSVAGQIYIVGFNDYTGASKYLKYFDKTTDSFQNCTITLDSGSVQAVYGVAELNGSVYCLCKPATNVIAVCELTSAFTFVEVARYAGISLNLDQRRKTAGIGNSLYTGMGNSSNSGVLFTQGSLFAATIGADTYPLVRGSAKDVEF